MNVDLVSAVLILSSFVLGYLAGHMRGRVKGMELAGKILRGET